jgi:hypothetical protein
VLQLLEHACAKYPAFDGRFKLVSGITLTFNASKPPGNRVVHEIVMISGYPIDLVKEYKVGL